MRMLSIRQYVSSANFGTGGGVYTRSCRMNLILVSVF